MDIPVTNYPFHKKNGDDFFKVKSENQAVACCSIKGKIYIKEIVYHNELVRISNYLTIDAEDFDAELMLATINITELF